ncbi:hypothetical protein ANO11243_048900 [Dothideomycetidae sp. 11243]|nr:hypothetical protein ANO11243_048900 [fungal sp. No.11243]
MSSSDLIAQLTTERDTLVDQILAASRCTTTSGPVSVHTANGSTRLTQEARIDAALESCRQARQEHIRLLGRYNNIKDVAQELIGMVAEMRTCRVVDVMRDLGVADDD